MFQNINEEAIENSSSINRTRQKINVFSNVFTIKYLAIYIVAFMVSMVGLAGGISPFSIAIIAACFANSIPAIGVVIASLIGNCVGFGVNGGLEYLITTLVIVISFFVIRPVFNENDKNEQIKIAKNVFIATLLVQLVQCFINGFMLYDILVSITFSIIVTVFYKIFVNSLCVLEDFNEKKAFTIEEMIGASLLLAVAVGCFGELSILGVSIRNVLSILIVLVLGWKNGVLVGTTAGVTIGVTLGTITASDPITIAAYAISGMVAGILNKFGKLGVIVGFVLGNIVFAYVSNGYTVELIHFKEILIASIGLLLIPKNINLDIEEFVGKSKFLPVFQNRGLNRSKEVIENLNNVSKTLKDMAENYKAVTSEESKEYSIESRKNNKQMFIAELLNDLDAYKDNLLYEDIANTEGKIVDDIFEFLLDKQEITREDLINIFAKNNSYIVGIDNNEQNEYLESNIAQIIRSINTAYKICKSDFIWQKKLQEKNQNIKTQLTDVSKAIHTMAEDIENTIKQDDDFKEEKLELIKQLSACDIQIQDLDIRKNNRYFVDMYIDFDEEKINKNAIEKVLSKVLKEEIVQNRELAVGNRLSFISADKYKMAMSISNATKSESETSGDSTTSLRLKDGNYLVALSDGMGTGNQAKQRSVQTLEMLENLLMSGFDKKTSIEMINSNLLNTDEEIFATLDVAIIDLYQGKIEFIKNAACPSYIKTGKKVQIIKSSSLPTGIVEDCKLAISDKDLNDDDILIICSDGILDSNIEYKNKELWIKYILEDIETDNTKKIADIILNESIDNNFGIAKDDLSVIACKFKIR